MGEASTWWRVRIPRKSAFALVMPVDTAWTRLIGAKFARRRARRSQEVGAELVSAGDYRAKLIPAVEEALDTVALALRRSPIGALVLVNISPAGSIAVEGTSKARPVCCSCDPTSWCSSSRRTSARGRAWVVRVKAPSQRCRRPHPQQRLFSTDLGPFRRPLSYAAC
jgi:hypothetical protein